MRPLDQVVGMDGSHRPFVVSARSLSDVALIDGGDTVAVRLRGADSGEVVLLLPRPLARDLGARLVADIPATISADMPAAKPAARPPGTGRGPREAG